jgi:hypothetical protein
MRKYSEIFSLLNYRLSQTDIHEQKTGISVIRKFLSYAVTVLTLIIIIIDALSYSIIIPIIHIDGAFQVASGLFRLEAGQLPGRDFYPYLGVGPLLAIFPIYKIAGGNLSAALFATKFITMLFVLSAAFMLYHLVFRPVNMIDSLAGSSVIFVLMLLGYLPLSDTLGFLWDPGNSIRGIRSGLPYITALTLYFLTKRSSNTNTHGCLIGISLGLTLLWSNDYAIPTFAVFSSFIFYYFYYLEKPTWKQSAALVVSIAILTWFVLLFIITAGRPLDMVKYNFDVAKDQWWYFAPYTYNSRILEISDLSKLFNDRTFIPFLVLLVMTFFYARANNIEYLLIIVTGINLFVGGCVASIGGHLLYQYFDAFYFMERRHLKHPLP